MEEQESKSWMREAYEATTRTLNSRIKRYKILIISIGVAVLGSIIWAIVWRSWSPLLGFVIIIPLCGLFFSSDAMLINKWQVQILDLWIDDELDIGLFIDTISQVKMFPKDTLQSMLRTLPERTLADKTPKEVKESVKITLQTINHCQVDRIVFSTLTFSLVLGLMAFALLNWTWISLIGLPFAFIAFAMGKVFCFIRFQKWKRNIQRRKPDITCFVEIADKLDWGTVHKRKQKFLDMLIRQKNA